METKLSMNSEAAMNADAICVSVVLATFRRKEPLRLVLSDLARQRDMHAEIVLVDQNDPPLADTLLREISSSSHRLTVLRRPPGVVAARNAGAAAAAGEVLVFIDDDARIDDAQFLANHLKNFADASISAVCGQELTPPDFQPVPPAAGEFADALEEAMFFPRASSQRRDAFTLSTVNCSIRRTAWEQVGGLDAAFAGNSYGDDYDLALRMRAAGLRIVFDPSASVRHAHAPMGGLRLADPAHVSAEADKYVSLWLFYFRHITPRWRRWYLREAILRKSLLLRRNAIRPWRWPLVSAGLLQAYFRARRLQAGR